MPVEVAVASVTLAEAVFAVFAALVAFTVIVAGEGAVAGAVYRPLDEIVPQADPLQPEPDTAQLTEVFEDPLTVAANCSVAPVFIETVVGLTETAIAGAVVAVPLRAMLVVAPVELLLVIESWPESLAEAVGANCIEIVKDDPGFRVAGRVGAVILKPVPDMLAALMVRAAVPDEVRVTVCEADEPTCTLPNEMLLALAPIFAVFAAAVAFNCR